MAAAQASARHARAESRAAALRSEQHHQRSACEKVFEANFRAAAGSDGGGDDDPKVASFALETDSATMKHLETQLEAAVAELATASNHSIDLEFRWCLRLAETVSGEADGDCSGEPRTARVVGTIDRPNRT